MQFIDEAIIEVTGGHGGKGCVSFRREKYEPRGGPNGGHGGNGGSVIFVGSEDVTTLLDFRYKKKFVAEKGVLGKGSMQDGRAGEDIVLKVPLGTLVYDNDTGELLCDIDKKDQKFIAAQGGRGGKGNAFFTTSTRQAPDYAQPGEEGQTRNLRLELKLLADVGLVGMPNAGKSTFLTIVSNARPKVADYPFTTLAPSLGVVIHKNYPPFVVADIPGLIEGAHEGKGLGIQFLKHIERTAIFLHLISVSPDEAESPFERYQTIKKELESYDSSFKKRLQVIVLTKVDLLGDEDELKKIMAPFKKKKLKVFPLSAITREGLDDLLTFVAKAHKK